MYQKMLRRKSSKKGFTLVEVIVVLVILAILAAIMIPAMTGWIDEAKNKQIVVSARTFLLAAQTCASEDYATNSVSATYSLSDDRVKALTGDLKGTAGTANANSSGQIYSATYTEGKVATYNGTTWTVGEATP